jgi:thioredoxin-like negative regulator of GroEL
MAFHFGIVRMTIVSEIEFRQSVLQAHQPVLVHFAGNGDASGALGPILDRLASRLAGRSLIARVDLAANAELARRFDVFAPTLVYFKGGSATGRRLEALDSADALFGWLDTLGVGCACHPG